MRSSEIFVEALELAVATIVVAITGGFLICLMKEAFGGGSSTSAFRCGRS
jgi:hypothetical protein